MAADSSAVKAAGPVRKRDFDSPRLTPSAATVTAAIAVLVAAVSYQLYLLRMHGDRKCAYPTGDRSATVPEPGHLLIIQQEVDLTPVRFTMVLTNPSSAVGTSGTA